MTATIIRIDMDAVDRRLRDGELWTDGWGQPWDPEKPTCLHGAIRYCEPVPGDSTIIQAVGNRYGFGTFDNDHAASWPEIRSKVIPDITDNMLEGTFGPQWAHVVALVRRASALTSSEADRMASIVDDDPSAVAVAWTAAEDAAMNTGRGRVLSAAWIECRPPYAPARASIALAVRDLIGQHGFTQEHYDALTAPWAAVIGKVHPDDPERNTK